METTKTLLNTFMADRGLSGWDRILATALSRIGGGRICVSFPGMEAVTLGRGNQETADLRLLPGASRRIVLGGAMGFAEAHLDGLWDTRDLAALLRVLGRSQAALGPVARGSSAVLRFFDRLGHRLRSNTHANARRNIQEHYDLSNDLYTLFLDPSLTYSSAIFAEEGEELEVAQMRKIDRLIEGLNPGPGDHVLEIGSGWGACAIRLARRTGCRVTSLTLSDEQAAEARRRVREAGLEDRVEIRLQDYRDVRETFDHAVSVEMIEAVGHEYLPGYIRSVHRRLRPGGRFALQAITIPDERYERYHRGCDFIRKHVFPGGHLPSPGLLERLFLAQGPFHLLDHFEFGTHYAETLRRWRDAFLARTEGVLALGFNERFLRKWHYYLAYCEAGFDTGLIHVRQYLLAADAPPVTS